MVKLKLSDVCADDLVASHILQFSASVGIKLFRANVVSKTFTPERICKFVAAESKPPKEFADQESTKKWIMTVQNDCVDELLASDLLNTSDLTQLLCATAARNFLAASAMLLERGANLHHIEVRRCRRRGIVDIAAHAASMDDDWRLVLMLLERGAVPISPQGVLFTPLRQGNIRLARELLQCNFQCGYDCLSSLLCDMCSHGQLPSIALLLDEYGVPVNTLNKRDGLTGTDRAIAWQQWETAAWLISQRQGMPSQKEMALGNLVDASEEPCVLRLIDMLLGKQFFNIYDVLHSVVRRGDFTLCQNLLDSKHIKMDASLFLAAYPVVLVDTALCHGHLRIARMLLSRGVKPRNPARCRADASLHGGSTGSCHQVVHDILQMLPAAPGDKGSTSEVRLSSQYCSNRAAEHMASGLETSVFNSAGLGHDADSLALVPVCVM